MKQLDYVAEAFLIFMYYGLYKTTTGLRTTDNRKLSLDTICRVKNGRKTIKKPN